MYDELIAALRGPYNSMTDIQIKKQAADAIESLSKLALDEHNRAAVAAWERRWIPVEERLPNKGQKVLIYWREAGEPAIDTAFWQGEWAAMHWANMGEKVTHWMPLPEPPKEE